jgi:hypothetical protein
MPLKLRPREAPGLGAGRLVRDALRRAADGAVERERASTLDKLGILAVSYKRRNTCPNVPREVFTGAPKTSPVAGQCVREMHDRRHTCSSERVGPCKREGLLERKRDWIMRFIRRGGGPDSRLGIVLGGCELPSEGQIWRCEFALLRKMLCIDMGCYVI